MANKDIGAKQLAMYADNPVRFCNLRGQLEGVAGSAGTGSENDRTVRMDHWLQTFRGMLIIGLACGLAGAVGLSGLVTPELTADDELLAAVLLVAGLALTLGAGIGILRRRRVNRQAEICERFKLDPEEYRVIAANIMGNRGRVFRANGLSAVPHAVFLRTKGHRSHHVALLLNRPYAGRVHDGDLFRLTLQMGIVRRHLGVRTISGSIRYTGKLVKVAYSDTLYFSLQRMSREYLRSVRRWWPENRLSLRDRQRVAAGEAIRSSAVDWPDEYSI